ncbi:hypothetical protein DL98DRAFT_564525 [Cadophora sp. DSE1049]|nr:hypothetical protein DL98DRAFT_564525 [Cadophora sp. DSE1049]
MGSSRTAIPHSQRVALRHYYQTTNPKPSHAALKMWFKSQFGHEISQSIVSRSLSDNFAYLDVVVPAPQVVPKYRIRSCQWPCLELLLSDWLQVVEGQSGKVSSDDIKRKARQIWNDSDESQGLEMPKFSSGWVTKFRRRNEMRQRPPHSGSMQDPIAFPALSKAKTRDVPTNNTRPDSEFSTSTTLTFSSDQLIHLIQLNVFRALISNKNLLRTVTNFVTVPHHATSADESAIRLCGRLSVVRPFSDHNVPASLYPTLLQMNCAHTGWIDMFPFPRFRDNLIKKGAEFVPEEMRQDLCGDLFPDYIGRFPRASAASVPNNDGEFGDPDDYTAGRTCLINWGDPWNIESWEVTPGFLKRWGWALEGCDDLFRASNRWRASRNEELIPCW